MNNNVPAQPVREHMNKTTRYTTVEPYDYQNELLNGVYDAVEDGKLWIVNGVAGRKPVLADTKSEALARYLDIYVQQ